MANACVTCHDLQNHTLRLELDGYDVTTGVRAIVDFVVDDLSNWYVRRAKI